MSCHHLKTWPSYITDVVNGKKTFEVRVADRDYRVGDFLWLLAFDPLSGWLPPGHSCPSKRAPECEANGWNQGFGGICVRVTYILGPTHTPHGYVIMSIEIEP